MSHQYFQEFFQPLAVEYRVVDLKHSIGGTLDAYGIDKRTNKRVLMDLKTQSNPNANAYNTNEQLGGYYSMLMKNNIQVDECRTVWCRPNKTTVGEFEKAGPEYAIRDEDGYEVIKLDDNSNEYTLYTSDSPDEVAAFFMNFTN